MRGFGSKPATSSVQRPKAAPDAQQPTSSYDAVVPQQDVRHLAGLSGPARIEVCPYCSGGGLIPAHLVHVWRTARQKDGRLSVFRLSLRDCLMIHEPHALCACLWLTRTADAPPAVWFGAVQVVGVGGGGSNAVNRMKQSDLHGIDYFVMNTDVQVSSHAASDHVRIPTQKLSGHPRPSYLSATQLRLGTAAACISHLLPCLHHHCPCCPR